MVRALAKAGYVSKGVVYVVVGVLAVEAAIGAGGELASPRDALAQIAGQPFGGLLLGLVVLGLLAHAVWRFVQAIGDVDGDGHEPKALVKRAALLVSGLAHASLALVGAGIVLHDGLDRGGSGAHGTLAIVAGLVTGGVGVWQMVRAWTGTWKDRLDLGRMGPSERTWAERAAAAGLVARGIVFLIVASYLVGGHEGGLDDALGTLAAHGPVPLGLVALGLLMYGVYQFVEARYRRLA
jgi:hypothetical protein